jgi:hypothetical protein
VLLDKYAKLIGLKPSSLKSYLYAKPTLMALTTIKPIKKRLIINGKAVYRHYKHIFIKDVEAFTTERQRLLENLIKDPYAYKRGNYGED